MKIGIKRAFGVILAMAMTLGMFFAAQGLVVRKNGDEWYGQFFREDLGLEVLFLGTSHVYNGVYPLEMWRDYGIAGYVLASPGSTIPLNYWSAVNALDHCQPKVIVLDCFRISSEEGVPGHLWWQDFFDSMPMSRNKLRAIEDLVDIGLEKDVAISLCWPFYNDHSRWSQVNERDITYSPSYLKGAQLETAPVQGAEALQAQQPLELGPSLLGPEYLRRLAALCQERGIELLLTYLPYPTTERDYAESLAVEELARELGLSYVNFLDLDLVDYQTDMSDATSHLNYSGALKVTDYLGQILSRDYGLGDHRQDQAYAAWQEDLAAWDDEKLHMLMAEPYLNTKLCLLADDGFSAAIKLDGGSPVYLQPLTMALIRNAAGQELPGLEEAARKGEDYALLIDRGTGQVEEFAGEDIQELAELLRAELMDYQTGVRIWPTGRPEEAFSCNFRMADIMAADDES